MCSEFPVDAKAKVGLAFRLAKPDKNGVGSGVAGSIRVRRCSGRGI